MKIFERSFSAMLVSNVSRARVNLMEGGFKYFADCPTPPNLFYILWEKVYSQHETYFLDA